MRRLAFLSALLIISGISFGQSNIDWADMQWGEELKKPKGAYWGTQAFNDDNNLSLWIDGTEFNMINTTGNMNFKKAGVVDIEHQAKKGKWYYESTFRLGNSLMVMTKIKVKKEEKFYYYLQRIDPISLRLDGTPELIGEMTFLRSTFKEIEDYKVSPDYSKFYFGHNNGKKDLSKFWYEVTVYNAELDLVYEDKIEIEKDEALNTAYIDFWKNGDVAVLAKRVKEKKDREKGKPNYYYTAAVMRGGELTKYKLDLNEYFISGFGITFNKQGNVVMSGYYSPNSGNRVNGVFYIAEEDGELNAPKYHEFSVEEISKYMSERAEKKNKKKEDKGKEIQFMDYDVHDLIVTDDGTYLVGEQAWITVTTTHTSNGTYTTYHYYFMDIMTIKFDSDGDVEWTSRVPKYNYSKNDGGRYSSFSYDYDKDHIYFLYNDHIENHTNFNPKKILKSPWGGDKAVTCVAKINSDGEMQRGYLYNIKAEALFTKVKSCERLGEGENGFLIIGQKKKKIKLARVVVE